MWTRENRGLYERKCGRYAKQRQALTAYFAATVLRHLATGFLAAAFAAAACAAASRSAASLARRNARNRADFSCSAFRRWSYSDMAAGSSCFLKRASAALEDFVFIVPNIHDTAVVSYADCWDDSRKDLERRVPQGARGPPDRDSRPGISQCGGKSQKQLKTQLLDLNRAFGERFQAQTPRSRPPSENSYQGF